jgi:hemerythrin superfamily protein
MNIYEILKDEHREVSKLIEQAKDAAGAERDELVEQILEALTLHTAAEEDVFYDRVASSKALHEMIGEAKEEHLAIARLLSDLTGSLDDDELDAKLEVLGELLEHHIEEEEDELFPTAEGIIDDAAAEAIGGQFLARKEEIEEMPVEDRIAEALAKHGVVEEQTGDHKPQRKPTPEEEERTAERG